MKIGYKLSVAASALFLLAACETPPGAEDAGGVGGDSGYGTGALTNGNVGELAPGVTDRVFFAYDSSVLTGDAQATLERQANWLRGDGASQNVVVEGHCDERGTREYNLALGERRAAAAKSYLVSLGVASERVSTVSYGKERPAVLGSDESAWGQNRRAVTVLAR
jgi:peptidoglycan-associated lipoprotein